MSRSNVKAAALLAGFPLALAHAPEQPAVVNVRVWTGSGVAERATGTVLGDGRVLTVAHVLDGARRIEVDGRAAAARPRGDTDGRAAPLGDAGGRRATVERRLPALDLAVLRADGVSGPPVRYGEAGGELRVLTPRGAKPAALNRRVSVHFVGAPGRRPSLDVAARIVAGDSGAPVVDRDGRVVGVIYARSTRRDAAYAVRLP
ncbi:MAG TPA: serine protease [Solirubrobacter sp.]|nr:serine protease [Solirubrobacter sp.]